MFPMDEYEIRRLVWCNYLSKIMRLSWLPVSFMLNDKKQTKGRDFCNSHSSLLNCNPVCFHMWRHFNYPKTHSLTKTCLRWFLPLSNKMALHMTTPTLNKFNSLFLYLDTCLYCLCLRLQFISVYNHKVQIQIKLYCHSTEYKVRGQCNAV